MVTSTEPKQSGGQRRPSAPASLPALRAGILIPALLVSIPPVLFSTILFFKALNLPDFDDYDAVLGFMNRFLALQSVSSRASWFFSSQHCEYKLIFLHTVTLLQFYLSGHIDFRILCDIAGGVALLLAVPLWKMFLPGLDDVGLRISLFVPVSWLLFQFEYCEALDFVTPEMQHVAGLVFSLSALCLLVRPGRWSFLSALVCLLLAVSADGIGLVLIPIGLLALTVGRSYTRIAAWGIAALASIAVYAYGYNVTQSGTVVHRSIFAVALGFRPDYVLAFMGSAVSFPFHFRAGSVTLGALLCAFFAWMAWRGYWRRNPAVSYCVLFLFVTAIGVAGLRSDFGVANIPSRYTMYSAVLLALAWTALAEEFVVRRRTLLINNGLYLGAVAVTVLFSLGMDMIGAGLMNQRNEQLIEAMTHFEHPTASDAKPSPAPDAVVPEQLGWVPNAFNHHAREVLLESMRLGIYQPPHF